MNTIDDVIREMDRIVDECSKEQLRAGYFAILYRMVTIRVKEEIEKGAFQDVARMERLDMIFAKRFFDAFDAWRSGDTPTHSWEVAFEASAESRHLVLQQMLLGINAHINLDLGIAASETIQETGGRLDDIRDDYMKINEILQAMVDRVRTNIGTVSPLFRLLIRPAGGRDDMFINFSIVAARDGAWLFAQRYYTSADKQTLLNERDMTIAALGRRIITPGRWTSAVLRMIRTGEHHSPDEVMRRLGSAVKSK